MSSLTTYSSDYLIKAQGIYKSYPQGSSQLEILKGVDLIIKPSEAISIVGASGTGKSTLLHILGTLDRPTRGELYFLGRDLLEMEDEELSIFRNQEMGFVFQFHHLLSEFTALENIMVPALVAGHSARRAKDDARRLLYQMGLNDRANHFPSQLSGGELQRVAIARALIRSPKILFADEPTGNLDSQNSSIIQDVFFSLQKELGIALVVVTHDINLAKKFPRQLKMRDGRWDDVSQTLL